MTITRHVQWLSVFVALAATPAFGADPTPARDAPPRHAVHATRGVVKSIDPEQIVVSRPNGRGDITFRLAPSVHRQGTIAVGALVSVRYEDRGVVHVAIAVAVRKP